MNVQKQAIRRYAVFAAENAAYAAWETEEYLALAAAGYAADRAEDVAHAAEIEESEE